MRSSGALHACVILIVVAMVSVETRAEADEEMDIDASGWTWGFSTDVELALETQGNDSEAELTFDEASFSLERGPFAWEMAIRYDSEGAGLRTEEFAATIDRGTWYAVAGRTVLPFGEYETSFVGDALPVSVGEISQSSIVLGWLRGDTDVAVGLVASDFGGGTADVVVAAKRVFSEEWRVGVSWTSDVGEASELAEIRDELGTNDRGIDADRVSGIATFVTFASEGALIHSELVGAADSFPAGILAPDVVQPWAWSVELGVQPATAWGLAARLELARDIPEQPERQLGTALSRALGEYVVFTVDYLHGTSRDASARHMVSAELGIEF